MSADHSRYVAWSPVRAREIADRHADLPGGLLVALHAVQNEFGYVDPAAVSILADALNLSRADVHGVVSFYHHFRSTPPGRTVLRVCQAEACQSMGAARLAEHARQRLGIGFHDTTPDGAVSLEPVYCLGNCALAPAVMLDETLHGRMSGERLDALLAEQTG